MDNREAIEWLKGCVVAYEVDNKGKPNGNVTCELIQEVIDMAISALEKQEQDRWIPVSKDLPKKNGDYLVTCEVCGERYVEESFFCRCDDGDVFWTSQNVIAWQPRIEHYTAE